MGKVLRSQFPETLCCTFPLHSSPSSKGETGIDIPFHVIKGGLALRPSSLAQSLLKRVVLYMHGKETDPVFSRLFTYYYGDQLAVYLAINDLVRFHGNTSTLCHEWLQWLDYATSPIANLDATADSSVYIRKGDGFRGIVPAKKAEPADP